MAGYTVDARLDTQLSLTCSRVFAMSTPVNSYMSDSSWICQLATGTGDYNADLGWHGRLTIKAAGTNIDLSALGDNFFAVVGGGSPDVTNFAQLKLAAFRSVTANGTTVSIDPNLPAITTPWGRSILVYPGGSSGGALTVITTPQGVTIDATNKTLTFSLSGGSVDTDIDVFFVGVSA